MSVRALPGQADQLSTYLRSLEEFLFDPVERRNATSVSTLLTEDFREFGSSGRVYNKLDIIAELGLEEPVSISMSDFTCDLVAPGVALVTYRSIRRYEGSTHEGRPPMQAMRSSLWVQRPVQAFGTAQTSREMRWQMLFHQGTRL